MAAPKRKKTAKPSRRLKVEEVPHFEDTLYVASKGDLKSQPRSTKEKAVDQLRRIEAGEEENYG